MKIEMYCCNCARYYVQLKDGKYWSCHSCGSVLKLDVKK